MPVKKKINYVVFDANGGIKEHHIGNLVATSDKADEIIIVADFDISTEETAYRCYARVKRADGFILGPFTLILDQLTADEAEEIGVEYLACRKLVMTKDMLEVDGRVMITIVFDQVNTEGKVVSTKATGMVVANIYDAVPEILTEEEYNDIKTEMLPRDLGDLTVTDTVLDTDVIIVNADGVSKKITLEDLMKNFGLDSYASVAEQVNTNKDNIESLGAASSDFVQKAELFDSSMKIKSSYFAEYLKTGMKPIGVITTSGDKTTADLLEEIQSAIGVDTVLQRGCYFTVHYDGPSVEIEISQGHNIMVADDGRIGQDSGDLVLETNDLLVYVGVLGVKHQWMVINNTYPTADASTYGVVMLATEQEALAGTNQSKAMTPKDVKLAIDAVIGETDPIFAAWDKSTGISITKSQVSDLIEATQSLSGLMSATDKQRLDALYALLEEDTENNVVDSINEILAIFQSYPEGADLVTALAGKADATHTHTKSQITDFPTTMTPTAHTHTKSEITDFPTSMPPTAHNHDSDYYKKSEAYSKTEIDTMIGDIDSILDSILGV